jgi:hypothetical protein
LPRQQTPKPAKQITWPGENPVAGHVPWSGFAGRERKYEPNPGLADRLWGFTWRHIYDADFHSARNAALCFLKPNHVSICRLPYRSVTRNDFQQETCHLSGTPRSVPMDVFGCSFSNLSRQAPASTLLPWDSYTNTICRMASGTSWFLPWVFT